jgi:hypothetical protein
MAGKINKGIEYDQSFQFERETCEWQARYYLSNILSIGNIPKYVTCYVKGVSATPR